MNTALLVIAIFFIVALAAGILAKRGVVMNLNEWAVANRSFGTVVTFILIAGEVFSTYSFLGATGWAYARGAPTFYYLGCASLAFVIGYWTLPSLWRFAQKRKLLSFSDFFEARFESKTLGLAVAAVALLAMIPLLVIQLKGLGIIVSESSYGSISENAAIWIGLTLMVVYIVVSGIRGAATVAVIKDVSIFLLALFLAIYLPLHYFGGFGNMFGAIAEQKPTHFQLPKEGLNLSWYNTTILLVTMGYYLYPYTFTSIYAAKSENSVRKNTIALPIYQMLITCMYMVGFAAITVVPNLKGADADLALFRIAKMTFDPWFVGVIGGVGLLTAVVPGAMILLNASTMVAKNIVEPHILAGSSANLTSIVARCTVPVYALIAVYALFSSGLEMVPLALLASNLLCQLFPAFLLGVFSKRPLSAKAAMAGMIGGLIVLGIVMIGFGGSLSAAIPWAPGVVKSANLGFVALCVNFITYLGFALSLPRSIVKVVHT